MQSVRVYEVQFHERKCSPFGKGAVPFESAAHKSLITIKRSQLLVVESPGLYLVNTPLV